MITSYPEDYKDAMRERFFEKFNSDDRPLVVKLKDMHMPKGTYSSLLNGTHGISKHTLETMRAYLENRLPKFISLDQKTHFYCCCCETVTLLTLFRSGGVCLSCKSAINRKTKKNNAPKYKRMRAIYNARFLQAGTLRATYLRQRKLYYLRKNYGRFAQSVLMIENLRKELKKYEV